MKKLLVLSLVLAVAGISSAALVVTAPETVMPGEEFQIVISGPAGLTKVEAGLYGAGASAAGVVIAGQTKFGNLSSAAFDVAYDGWEILVAGADSTGVLPIPAGDWIVFTAKAGAAGEVYDFDFYDYAVSYDAPVKSFVVSVIPEPMTMGLLGLGALFLRRRK